jgi:hypothetical protein
VHRAVGEYELDGNLLAAARGPQLGGPARDAQVLGLADDNGESGLGPGLSASSLAQVEELQRQAQVMNMLVARALSRRSRK